MRKVKLTLHGAGYIGNLKTTTIAELVETKGHGEPLRYVGDASLRRLCHDVVLGVQSMV